MTSVTKIRKALGKLEGVYYFNFNPGVPDSKAHDFKHKTLSSQSLEFNSSIKTMEETAIIEVERAHLLGRGS